MKAAMLSALSAALFTSSLAAAQTPPGAILATTGAEQSALAPTAVPTTDDDPQTLIGPDGFLRHSGWYVAPSFGVTGVDSHVGYLSGLRGAWVMNRTFGIGLAANGFGWDVLHSDSLNTHADRRMAGGYGGLLLQYNIAPDRLVHGFVDSTIGGGAACYDTHEANRWESCPSATAFFVFEPSANVEVNVTKFMRVAVGGGYRLALSDTMNKGLASSDLSGFLARANLEFGQF
jgi:hypothetical protein